MPMKNNIISYQTWRKYHYGHPMADGYKLCGDDWGYGLFKSVYPKDAAITIIHYAFTDEEIKEREFVYWAHPYKGHQSKMDYIEIWCKKLC